MSDEERAMMGRARRALARAPRRGPAPGHELVGNESPRIAMRRRAVESPLWRSSGISRVARRPRPPLSSSSDGAVSRGSSGPPETAGVAKEQHYEPPLLFVVQSGERPAQVSERLSISRCRSVLFGHYASRRAASSIGLHSPGTRGRPRPTTYRVGTSGHAPSGHGSSLRVWTDRAIFRYAPPAGSGGMSW
jgi:hypothetical protein